LTQGWESELKRYSVVFSKGAEIDLVEIFNYYESRNRKFALELYQTVKARVLELSTTPERGREVPELEHQGIQGFRELIEGNYRIVYSISDGRVAVHTIVDSRRNLEELLMKKLQLEQKD
jgi:plasmid stabilization system protein ParE